MKKFTDYTVFWDTNKNSGRIQFFTPNNSSTMCTKEISERDIYMMLDLMQTQGIREFFIRFDVLLTPCREQKESVEV